jgi:Methyltransferase domain
MRPYLPARLDAQSFAGDAGIAALQSSYKDHGYGHLLYALARVMKPATCVELGVFQGFSLLSVAAALRDNARGHIDGFDLFGDYPYRHVPASVTQANVDAAGLNGRAHVHAADAFEVHERFDAVDWLHVDISNDGDSCRRLFEQWAPKVAQAMIFEGGAPERDEVEWMRAYGKPPLAPAIDVLRRSHPEWKFAVLSPYPSMTIALRGRLCG